MSTVLQIYNVQWVRWSVLVTEYVYSVLAYSDMDPTINQRMPVSKNCILHLQQWQTMEEQYNLH